MKSESFRKQALCLVHFFATIAAVFALQKAPPCICTDIGRLCVFPAKQISFSSRVCYTKELYHTLF